MKACFWRGAWKVIKRPETHKHLVPILKDILNKHDLLLLDQVWPFQNTVMNNVKIISILKGMHLSMGELWCKIKSSTQN